jgi:hypothetical protein
MTTAQDWANAWIADWVDAEEEPWCTRIGVRGLTDAQALRSIEYKLRDAAERRVVSITVHHDPWTARAILGHLDVHPLVTFVYCRTRGEMLAHLSYSSRS